MYAKPRGHTINHVPFFFFLHAIKREYDNEATKKSANVRPFSPYSWNENNIDGRGSRPELMSRHTGEHTEQKDPETERSWLPCRLSSRYRFNGTHYCTEHKAEFCLPSLSSVPLERGEGTPAASPPLFVVLHKKTSEGSWLLACSNSKQSILGTATGAAATTRPF